jgi:hypothetical protein
MRNASAVTPLKSASQARLDRIARFARWLVLVGGALLALNTVFAWFQPDYAASAVRAETQVALLAPLTLRTRVLAGAWDLVSILAPLVALAHLWTVFGEYAQTRIFSVRALRGLHGFARWMLATAVLTPPFRAVMSVIATWQNGPGRRELNLLVTSGDYLTLLFAVVVLAICSVMVEAARIAEDNKGFV